MTPGICLDRQKAQKNAAATTSEQSPDCLKGIVMKYTTPALIGAAVLLLGTGVHAQLLKPNDILKRHYEEDAFNSLTCFSKNVEIFLMHNTDRGVAITSLANHCMRSLRLAVYFFSLSGEKCNEGMVAGVIPCDTSFNLFLTIWPKQR